MTLTLRPATLDDAEILFAWRCDPDAARNSFGPVPTLADHMAWLTATLADPRRAQMIAEHNGVPVGTVRLDQHFAETELSLTVAPGLRGQGYGTAMIRAASCRGRMLARVRGDNVGSLLAFLKAGWRVRGPVVMVR